MSEERRSRLVVRREEKPAAGFDALLSTLQHARKELGATRGLSVLGRLNQDEGFDCPGCAWPDPERRTVAEFCENGAKHVADEATLKKADAAFLDRLFGVEAGIRTPITMMADDSISIRVEQ